MSKDRIVNLEEHLLADIDKAIGDVDHAVHDFVLHWHWSHWHPISTAPFNRDLELRVLERREVTLPFPCRHVNGGEWINVDLGTPIQIKPVSWRVWQHKDHAGNALSSRRT